MIVDCAVIRIPIRTRGFDKSKDHHRFDKNPGYTRGSRRRTTMKTPLS